MSPQTASTVVALASGTTHPWTTRDRQQHIRQTVLAQSHLMGRQGIVAKLLGPLRNLSGHELLLALALLMLVLGSLATFWLLVTGYWIAKETRRRTPPTRWLATLPLPAGDLARAQLGMAARTWTFFLVLIVAVQVLWSLVLGDELVVLDLAGRLGFSAVVLASALACGLADLWRAAPHDTHRFPALLSVALVLLTRGMAWLDPTFDLGLTRWVDAATLVVLWAIATVSVRGALDHLDRDANPAPRPAALGTVLGPWSMGRVLAVGIWLVVSSFFPRTTLLGALLLLMFWQGLRLVEGRWHPKALIARVVHLLVLTACLSLECAQVLEVGLGRLATALLEMALLATGVLAARAMTRDGQIASLATLRSSTREDALGNTRHRPSHLDGLSRQQQINFGLRVRDLRQPWVGVSLPWIDGSFRVTGDTLHLFWSELFLVALFLIDVWWVSTATPEVYLAALGITMAYNSARLEPPMRWLQGLPLRSSELARARLGASLRRTTFYGLVTVVVLLLWQPNAFAWDSTMAWQARETLRALVVLYAAMLFTSTAAWPPGRGVPWRWSQVSLASVQLAVVVLGSHRLSEIPGLSIVWIVAFDLAVLLWLGLWIGHRLRVQLGVCQATSGLRTTPPWGTARTSTLFRFSAIIVFDTLIVLSIQDAVLLPSSPWILFLLVPAMLVVACDQLVPVFQAHRHGRPLEPWRLNRLACVGLLLLLGLELSALLGILSASLLPALQLAVLFGWLALHRVLQPRTVEARLAVATDPAGLTLLDEIPNLHWEPLPMRRPRLNPSVNSGAVR